MDCFGSYGLSSVCTEDIMQTTEVFSTGASRDGDTDKLDYEGFISPVVLRRYAEFMHDCRKLPDGKIRDGDNWQKGIPITRYIKSLIRHTNEFWLIWRKEQKVDQTLACAVMFNIMGLLFEALEEEEARGNTSRPVSGVPDGRHTTPRNRGPVSGLESGWGCSPSAQPNRWDLHGEVLRGLAPATPKGDSTSDSFIRKGTTGTAGLFNRGSGSLDPEHGPDIFPQRTPRPPDVD